MIVHPQVPPCGDHLGQRLCRNAIHCALNSGASCYRLLNHNAINSARLFTNRLAGEVSCRMMVFSATHDHFTAPFEGLAIASRCPNAEFVLIERGDHLAPVENPKTVLALYDAFLNDRPLAEVPGVRVGAAAVEAIRERRILTRRDGRRLRLPPRSRERPPLSPRRGPGRRPRAAAPPRSRRAGPCPRPAS